MQLHLYVPDDVAKRIHERAESLGVSTSRYLASLVLRDVQGGWPPDFFDKVIGGWEGAPLERAAQGDWEKRESL
jgi:hypothetical protein